MSKTTMHIRYLCLAGVMAALYVGLDFLAVTVSAPFGNALKISLSGLPVILVSMLGGPLWGMATGFIGAFIGQLLTYGLSATTLLWVLPAMIRGLSMGLLFRAFGKKLTPGYLTLETVISSLLVTAANTGVLLIDAAIYGYSSPATVLLAVPGRVIAGCLTAVVFALMLPTIVNLLKKYFK